MKSDNRFPPTPGLNAALRRLDRAFDAAERRQRAHAAPSVAIQRVIDEMAEEQAAAKKKRRQPGGYNRVYHRHNR